MNTLGCDVCYHFHCLSLSLCDLSRESLDLSSEVIRLFPDVIKGERERERKREREREMKKE